MASASLETPSAPRRPRRVVLGPDSYWTETQWQILFALLDGVVPSIAVQEGATAKESDDDKATHLPITPAEFDQSYRSIRGAVQDAPSEDEVKEYLRARPLDNPAFVRAVKWLVAGVPARMKSQLGMFLNFLG